MARRLIRRDFIAAAFGVIATGIIASPAQAEDDFWVRTFGRNPRRKRRDDRDDIEEQEAWLPPQEPMRRFDRKAGTPPPRGDGDDPSLFPPPESPTDFPIVKVNLRKIPQQFHRQIVDYNDDDAPGTIIISPHDCYLYYVLENGQALRYGVGVGRQGFAWAGNATVRLKRRWPRWVPPAEMVARDKKAARWPYGQPGGPTNPLGARALYLFDKGVDTLYRIHGTNEPSSIGKALSSGCIRMLNEDIADLFDRTPIGTPVIVLGA